MSDLPIYGPKTMDEGPSPPGLGPVVPVPDDQLAEAAGPPLAAPPTCACWRCGHEVVPRRGLCPLCRARLTPDAAADTPGAQAPGRAALSLSRMLWVFAGLLAVSLVHGWFDHFGFDEATADRHGAQRRFFLIAVAEGLQTALVLATLVAVPRTWRPLRRPVGERLLAWALAFPF